MQVRPIADRTVRKQQIATAMKTTAGSLRVPFRGGFRDLPAGKINHEHLLFRLANGRTLGEQKQLIAEKALPVDQFAEDANPQAQAMQEQILANMAEIKDLMSILKQNGQTEPLLVLNDGVVINGNRRLATMRRIIAERGTLAHWPYIEIAVLPDDTTSDDILDIEARLQIAPEVKADYAWYDRGLLYERLSHAGKTDADIATMYHISAGAKEVNELLKMLRLAREFLISIEKPDGYGHLEKQYHAFKALRDNIDQEPDPARRVLVQELGFCHLRSIAKAGRRYDTMPGIRKHLDAISNRIATETRLPAAAPVSPVLATLLGNQLAPPSAAQQTAVLQAMRTNHIAPDAVAKCIDEVINEEERKTQDLQRLGALDEALDLAIVALTRAAEHCQPNSASQVTAKSQSLIDQVVARAATLQARVRARLTPGTNTTP